MKRRRFLTVTVGVMVLSGGLVLANYGGGVTPATAADITKDNHTLRWDTNNPSTSRFTTAFPGAVLDKNTGLVWEQAPDAVNTRGWGQGDTPIPATFYCVNQTVGGTRGWRLPSVAELASLIDPSLPAPFVPASVFTGVQSALYWSATTNAERPAYAWFVNFGNGIVGINDKDVLTRAWCVRGPMSESAY